MSAILSQRCCQSKAPISSLFANAQKTDIDLGHWTTTGEFICFFLYIVAWYVEPIDKKIFYSELELTDNWNSNCSDNRTEKKNSPLLSLDGLWYYGESEISLHFMQVFHQRLTRFGFTQFSTEFTARLVAKINRQKRIDINAETWSKIIMNYELCWCIFDTSYGNFSNWNSWLRRDLFYVWGSFNKQGEFLTVV